MKFGLNLYSIRNRLKTEEDFLAAANELREMGYSYMQFSGAPFDADMVRRVSEASGLPVHLTHVPMDRIINDTDALIDEHLKFGCKYIGLGMMPLDMLVDPEKLAENVAALERAAARIAERGGKLFYHNHHSEFYRQGGKTVLDYLIEKAPHLNFTLDVYWVQFGGADICDTIDRMAGRIACVHLKDYMITTAEGEKLKFEPRFAPVGDGNIDFPKVIAHARAAGAEYFFVEQDNAALLPDTMAQVERSAKYLLNID